MYTNRPFWLWKVVRFRQFFMHLAQVLFQRWRLGGGFSVGKPKMNFFNMIDFVNIFQLSLIEVACRLQLGDDLYLDLDFNTLSFSESNCLKRLQDEWDTVDHHSRYCLTSFTNLWKKRSYEVVLVAWNMSQV